MATDKKVIDVASPSDAKVDIGGKPMIVGHKSMATDPMVREKEAETPPSDKQITDSGVKEEVKAPENEEKLEAPSAKQKTIQPISESEKPEGEGDKKPEDSPETKQEAPNETEPNKEVAPETANAKVEDKKESDIDPIAAQMEQDENIRKMVESKKYNVSIKQARASKKGIFYGLVIFIVLGIVGLFIAIDTGKLDLGFKLPFTVFGEKAEPEMPQTNLEPVEQAQPEEAPVEETEENIKAIDTTKWSVFSSEGYSIKLPDGWLLRQKQGNTGSLFAPGLLKFTEGTPAVVEEYTEDSPLEGIFVLTIDSTAITDSAVATCENASQETVTDSYKLTTTAGETIFVTVEAGTKPINERELGDLVVGEKAYRYCATKANREIRASYIVQDDTDEHKYLEESLKTLTFTQ